MPSGTEAARDTQGQWSRVIGLDGEIRAGRHPSVQNLQEEFGVSRRTAFSTVTYHGSLSNEARAV
jgi:hypothetical protein